MSLPRSGLGRLQTKWPNVNIEYDRLLTELFIGGFNNEGKTDELLQGLTTLEEIAEATSECMLSWAYRVEAQRAKRIALSSIEEAKEFNAIWQKT